MTKDETSAYKCSMMHSGLMCQQKLMFFLENASCNHLELGSASMSEQKMCLVPEAQHWHFALELLQSDVFRNAESPGKSLKEIAQSL